MELKKRYNEPRIGPAAQKALLLLLGGVSLMLAPYPNKQWQIAKDIAKEWEKINKRALYNAIKNLYKNKLVERKENKDGTLTIILTRNGKNKALAYDIENLRIPKMTRWDRKWRIVLFDIPEKNKKGRDALAKILKSIGFYQFQKSVFVHPFECQNELDFVIEFFSLRPYVRTVIAEQIDNALHLKKHFDLIT